MPATHRAVPTTRAYNSLKEDTLHRSLSTTIQNPDPVTWASRPLEGGTSARGALSFDSCLRSGATCRTGGLHLLPSQKRNSLGHNRLAPCLLARLTGLTHPMFSKNFLRVVHQALHLQGCEVFFLPQQTIYVRMQHSLERQKQKHSETAVCSALDRRVSAVLPDK